ncbi:MAG: hypothetical protein AB7N65_17705 [Vicinamibacterales bacterium]
MALRWAQPTLVDPVTVALANFTDLNAYDGQDVIITPPVAKKTGPSQIYSSGAGRPRHIRMIGGHLTTST